jgi:hypothetical protein
MAPFDFAKAAGEKERTIADLPLSVLKESDILDSQ